MQDCVGERKRWSLWGTLEIHEHAHACIVGPLCARHYDLVCIHARIVTEGAVVQTHQCYRYTDTRIAAWARELPGARKHGSGFGRGPADGLVHKTRANARFSTARQPLQTPHHQQMARRCAAAQHKTCSGYYAQMGRLCGRRRVAEQPAEASQTPRMTLDRLGALDYNTAAACLRPPCAACVYHRGGANWHQAIWV